MHDIITWKYKKEWMKNIADWKVDDTVFPIITLSVTMETSGWIWPNFKLIQNLMYVIITCKYEKEFDQEQRRKSGDIVLSHYKPMGIFSDVQGQLRSAVCGPDLGRNVELVHSSTCMLSMIPASMKRIGWKTAWEKACRHSFSPLKPYGSFLLPWKARVLIRSGPKPYDSLSPNQMMLQIKFGCDRPTGCRDIHVMKCCEHTVRTDVTDGRHGSTGIL